MTFEELISQAVSRDPDDGEAAPQPSMDILSRAMFQEVLEDARHFGMHRNPFASMLSDLEGGMSPFAGDLPPPPPGPPTDMTLVESQLGRNDALDRALGAVQDQGPSTADMVRDLLRSL
jgi:hypothetical protein